MENESKLGSDEFEVIIELIITVIFMSICVYYTAIMINKMNTFADLTYGKDKIDITNVHHEAHDPFYFDGFGALMIGWVYDDQSTVPVTWLGATSNNIESPDVPGEYDNYVNAMQVDESIDEIGSSTENINYAMLSSLHYDGSPISNYETWKPQVIAGSNSTSSIGHYNNVIKTIRSIVNSVRGRMLPTEPLANSEKAAIYNFYRGQLSSEYGKLYYHLEYNPTYNKTLDTSDYIERNKSQWVLVPKYRQ